MSHPSSAWPPFLTSLPGGSASKPRVRLRWALKGPGVAILRYGVALLRASAAHRAAPHAIGAQVVADGGPHWLMELPAQGQSVEDQLRGAVDRSELRSRAAGRLGRLARGVSRLDEAAARGRLRQAKRDLDAVVRTDLFPGNAVAQSREDLRGLVALIDRRFSPREPATTSGCIERLEAGRYCGRLLAARRRGPRLRGGARWPVEGRDGR